jgi:hypothetical protein
VQVHLLVVTQVEVEARQPVAVLLVTVHLLVVMD